MVVERARLGVASTEESSHARLPLFTEGGACQWPRPTLSLRGRAASVSSSTRETSSARLHAAPAPDDSRQPNPAEPTRLLSHGKGLPSPENTIEAECPSGEHLKHSEAPISADARDPRGTGRSHEVAAGKLASRIIQARRGPSYRIIRPRHRGSEGKDVHVPAQQYSTIHR